MPSRVFLGSIKLFDLPIIYIWQKNAENAVLRNAKAVPKNFFSVIIWYAKILRFEPDEIQYFAIRSCFSGIIGYASVKIEIDKDMKTAVIGIFLGKSRNVGFGSSALELIEVHCLQRDIPRLKAIINSKNTISENFFKKNGFKIISQDLSSKIYTKEIKSTNNLD